MNIDFSLLDLEVAFDATAPYAFIFFSVTHDYGVCFSCFCASESLS